MQYNRVQADVESSIALHLLRSPNLPLIAAFLYSQFKNPPRVKTTQSELIEALQLFLNSLNLDGHQTGRNPKELIDAWCQRDKFLTRLYPLDGTEPQLELTPGTEKALGFLAGLEAGPFVGTESRFKMLYDQCEDLVVNASQDSALQIELLEKQMEILRSRLEQVTSEGGAQAYNETQIIERYDQIKDLAQRLVSDFKQIAENFATLAAEVPKKQLQQGLGKGRIVADILDADDLIINSHQGRSFYAFWKYLISPSLEERLNRLLEQIYAMPVLLENNRNEPFLRDIKKHLVSAAGVIVQTNGKLAEAIRKLLDGHNEEDNRRVSDLLREIKLLAMGQLNFFDPVVDFLEIDEHRTDIQFVMDRPDWHPDGEQQGIVQNLRSDEELATEPVSVEQLYDPFDIDEKELERRIAGILERQQSVGLVEVVARHPITRGAGELLAYLTIAARGRAHSIEPAEPELVVISGSLKLVGDRLENAEATITLPKVVFRASAS